MLIGRKARPIRTIGLLGMLVLSLSAFGPTDIASAQDIEIGDIVIFATNSITVNRNGVVVGGVVANQASPGPTLNPSDVELHVDQGGSIDGFAKADSVDIRRNTTISGDLQHNDGVVDPSASIGSLTTPLPLPVVELPNFESASIGPGAVDVAIGRGETVALAAGEYGDITIDQGGILQLNGGGIFHIRSITQFDSEGGQCPVPCRSIQMNAAADVRIAERLDLGKDAFIGDPGGGLGGSDFIYYVGGGNATPTELPAVFHTGRDSTVTASVFAPNGTIRIDQGSTLDGTLIGKDVLVDKDAMLTLNSFFFRNPPVAVPHDPVADAQDVFTNGSSAITIVLTGSDPDGDSLIFSTHNETTGTNTCTDCLAPSAGTLSGLTAIVPAPIQVEVQNSGGNNDGICDAGETCEEVQPPTVSATVLYSPFTPAANDPDSFEFMVDDSNGGTDIATVRINPPANETTGFVTVDLNVQTVRDTPVAVVLPEGTTGAPCADCVSPVNGTLGPLVVVSGLPQVTYTPKLAFVGSDAFEYEACDPGAPANCDIGTVDIEVVAPSGEAAALTLAGFPVTVVLPIETVDVAGGPQVEDPNATGGNDDGICDDGEICIDAACAVEQCEAPANGALSEFGPPLRPTVLYTPNAGFGASETATDSFEFCGPVCDFVGKGLATVTVIPQNLLAVDLVGEDQLTATAGEELIVTLRSRVADFQCFSVDLETFPELVQISEGGGSPTYAITLSEAGTYQFTFSVAAFLPEQTLCDQNGISDFGTVVIEVLEGAQASNCELTPTACDSNRLN